ncbi:synaptosomal-associated protein 29-like [Huso huso]|uniref:Synaptosomal-associated protein 29 n=1 Tax=Huso huso TaxID=61971 RepID=A0ABR0YUN0_HUSHU
MMSAYRGNRNPFADDDDEDFGGKASGSGGWSEPTEAEDRQRWLEQEVMRTAQSAVDSSQRSVSLIYESEKVGSETAEELIRQGEALKRTERMVDNMDQDLKTSQRHINSIKSVFGGLVNYFKPKPETKPPPEQPPDYKPSSRLQDALVHSKEQEQNYQASHPNLRKIDTGGFGAGASADFSSSQSSNGYPKNKQLMTAHQQLDNNLDDMAAGLSRLKNLGLGLQTEIDSQDLILDRLTGKVDNMDLKIRATDQQLKKL